MLMNALCW